jgi:hypothetical protein
MKKLLLLFLGFGLLPIWIIIIITLFQGYTLATHWYFISALPLCGITLAIAIFTFLTYYLTPGDESKRFKLASVIFVVLVGLTFYMTFGRDYIRGNKIKKERSLAEDFVIHNEDVIREAGGIKKVYLESSITKVMPHRYEVSVHGNNGKHIYAIVGVSRHDGNVKFSLDCTTSLSAGYRDAFDDCKQSDKAKQN